MKIIIKRYAPWIIVAFHLLKLIIREKKILPSKVNLTSGHILFANPLEYRGRCLLLNKGTGQPALKRFWQKSIELFNPEVIIDCGANYGEVIFGISYPKETKLIIGIEANPLILPYLEKSKNIHPNSDRMVIFNALASDRDNVQSDFYIDDRSSGSSTALPNNFPKKSKKITVSTIRIDNQILKRVKHIKCLVFKIDVEGYESFVMEGMSELFKKDIKAMGCIEFNTKFLKNNKIDMNIYFNFLFKHFDVVASMNQLGDIIVHNHNDFIDRFIKKNEDLEIDLIITNNTLLFNQMVSKKEEGILCI